MLGYYPLHEIITFHPKPADFVCFSMSTSFLIFILLCALYSLARVFWGCRHLGACCSKEYLLVKASSRHSLGIGRPRRCRRHRWERNVRHSVVIISFIILLLCSDEATEDNEILGVRSFREKTFARHLLEANKSLQDRKPKVPRCNNCFDDTL